MPPLLIVNADDFGLEEEINTAIVRAHNEGIVTSASLLANGSAFEHAAALAQQNPRLGVGAHLTLTRGPSLVGAPLVGTEAPSLAGREGLLAQSPVLFAMRAAFGLVSLREVKREFRAQLERIRDAGIVITHIDSHQHIHLAPSIFDVVLDLAGDFDVKWIRMTLPLPLSPEGRSLKGRMKQGLLKKLALWNVKKAKRAGIQWADYHTGIEYAGRMREDIWIDIVRRLPDAVVEVSCHPGADDLQLGRNHPWGYHWGQELTALCSDRVRAALQEAHVDMVNYRDIVTRTGRA